MEQSKNTVNRTRSPKIEIVFNSSLLVVETKKYNNVFLDQPNFSYYILYYHTLYMMSKTRNERIQSRDRVKKNLRLLR